MIPGDQVARPPRKKRVIVLEEMDFVWDECELNEIARMVNGGTNLFEIGKHFDRDPDEVFMACLHLARKGRVKGLVIG